MVLSQDNVTDFFLLNAIVNGAALAVHAVSAGALWVATKIDKRDRAKEAKAGRKYRKGDVHGTRVDNPYGSGYAWHRKVFVKYLDDGTEVWQDLGIDTRM